MPQIMPAITISTAARKLNTEAFISIPQKFISRDRTQGTAGGASRASKEKTAGVNRRVIHVPVPSVTCASGRSAISSHFRHSVAVSASARGRFFMDRSSVTGLELKQLREDLGDAIGRSLSSAEMAKLC